MATESGTSLRKTSSNSLPLRRSDAGVAQQASYPTANSAPAASDSSSAIANAATQRRHKRYAPKVRTGCLTCKKRRVKCDETKPKCLKCLNSDYKCDGYVVPKAWIFEPASKTSPSSSSATIEGDSPASTSSEEEKVHALTPALRSHTFTPDEARSMQFYLRRSGRIIAQYDHERHSFWLGILPRGAHRFESVKHMIVAIGLQDEIFTSATTIPKIERRIAYHYQAALQKTAHGKPSIDQILLNCLAHFYFDNLRDDMSLVALHIESARKIIDEWRLKDEKVTPEILELIEAVDGVVIEAQTYSQTTPNPPYVPDVDWEKTPSGDPYESAEDAEHGLIAAIGNLSRTAGQVPLGLVRARTFLNAWIGDSRPAVRNADVDFTLNLASLYQIAQDMIQLLDETSYMPQNERWFKMLNSLQEMPKLRSVKYRKPVTALVTVLQQRAKTAEQFDAVKALQKHLQRGIVYDG